MKIITYIHKNPLWSGIFFRPTRNKNMVWRTKRHQIFRVFKGDFFMRCDAMRCDAMRKNRAILKGYCVNFQSITSQN